MKLSSAKLYYNLPLIFLVLIVNAALFAFFLEHTVEKNVKEVINIRKEYIVKELQQWNGNEQELEKYAVNNIYQIKRIDDKHILQHETVSDTTIYNHIHNDYLLYRQLGFVFCKNGKCYNVYVRKALVDYHSILKTVITWIIIESFLIGGMLALFNSAINKKIMQPFYAILNSIKNFNLDKKDEIVTVQTNVEEFKEMNATIVEFTEKLKNDYNELKDFTSHLTHELQTPLMVIRAHTDLLTQDENMTEDQLKSLGIIQRTVENMKKFEDALVFLKRIELGEFEYMESLNLKALLHEKLDDLEELFNLKSLDITIRLKDSFEIKIHPQLLEALLNNLISNAVRHNYDRGTIDISLADRTLTIKNTYIKHAHGSDVEKKVRRSGLGLGLDIIKTICMKYSFELEQHTKDGYYISTIRF